MEKNIIALLDINLRVIIPDFGAFIIRQKEPKIVVFNEFLRYNDGLLIEYIAKTEGIEKEIAEQRIADFVEEASKILDNGSVFVIKGLGSLIKDSTGKINFTEAAVKEKVKKEIVKEEIKPELQEPVQEPLEKIELKNPDEIAIKPVTEEGAGSVPKTRAKRSAKTTYKAIKDENAKKSVIHEPVESPVTKEPAQVYQVVEEKPSITDESPQMQVGPAINRTNQVLIWILLILFANAAILAWFVYKEDIRGIFKKNRAPAEFSDSVIQRLSDSVKVAASDTTLVFGETADQTEVLPAAQPIETARYYIIAGSFVDEANADALVASLKIRGFKAEKFVRTGNRYYVSFASFNNKESAYKELKRIREEVEPKAWLSTVSEN